MNRVNIFSTLLLLLMPALLAAPCQAATVYTYDELNRLTRVAYDDGRNVAYSYDSAGNLLQRVNEGSAPANTTTIDIPATAFVRGTNVALSPNNYGADVLLNAPPYGEAANAAEWDFNVPVAATYELFAEYAALVSRPVVIAFNGTVKFNNALSVATGGWVSANQRTILQGAVTLPAGMTTMRVSRSSVFPHIRGFKLVPVPLINPANGHRYEIITCGTWIQCDVAARAKGGNLVTIRSAAENAWIVSNIIPLIASGPAGWIGLTNDGIPGGWRWVSGEAFTYSAWSVGEPNNSQGIENYGHILTAPASIGRWNDISNNYVGAFGITTQAIVEYLR